MDFRKDFSIFNRKQIPLPELLSAECIFLETKG